MKTIIACAGLAAASSASAGLTGLSELDITGSNPYQFETVEYGNVAVTFDGGFGGNFEVTNAFAQESLNMRKTAGEALIATFTFEQAVSSLDIAVFDIDRGESVTILPLTATLSAIDANGGSSIILNNTVAGPATGVDNKAADNVLNLRLSADEVFTGFVVELNQSNNATGRFGIDFGITAIPAPAAFASLALGLGFTGRRR